MKKHYYKIKKCTSKGSVSSDLLGIGVSNQELINVDPTIPRLLLIKVLYVFDPRLHGDLINCSYYYELESFLEEISEAEAYYYLL